MDLRTLAVAQYKDAFGLPEWTETQSCCDNISVFCQGKCLSWVDKAGGCYWICNVVYGDEDIPYVGVFLNAAGAALNRACLGGRDA